MNDLVTFAAIFLIGLSLGGFFFGGLLWTIKRGLSATNPVFWFLGSWLVRIAVVLGVFYMVSAGRWERLVLCVMGFFLARIVLIRFTRQEADNASKS